jgi:hypothetical protein
MEKHTESLKDASESELVGRARDDRTAACSSSQTYCRWKISETISSALFAAMSHNANVAVFIDDKVV